MLLLMLLLLLLMLLMVNERCVTELAGGSSGTHVRSLRKELAGGSGRGCG
jgi:hypothetical protein